MAIGSVNGDIVILDAITGSQTATLSGHTKAVNSLNFSPDGKLLVSGSNDTTVKLWDMQTGGVIHTFLGHTHWVWSVSISADCTMIASGSLDHTIYLWDIQKGECQCIIKQQNVRSVSFFPNIPQCLLSISNNKVWQWNINGHQIGPTCDGSYISFSSDGTQFVSCNETTVVVQNSTSGVVLAKFHMTQGTVYCCCLSPDNKLIAVAVGSTAYIWDVTRSEPHLVGTFIGHTQDISFLTFSSSSSLITTSYDHSVKFWQIGTLDHIEADPKPTSLTSADINSITLQANDNAFITSDSDGIVRTWDILTGNCKSSFQTPAKYPCWSDVQLINGKLVLFWSADEKINIWDIEKEELLLTINEPGCLDKFWISGDRSRIFTRSGKFIYALSIQTGEIVGKVEVMGSDVPESLSVDGSKVWVRFPNSTYQGWDFGAPGSPPVKLPNTPPYKLHPNGTVLWDNVLHGVKDRATGKVIFQLPKGYGKPFYVQWNDQCLVVYCKFTQVLILDFTHVFH